jgi:hypothetical protein
MRRTRLLTALVALVGSTAFVLAPASAQDIQYRTVTAVKFAGAFGKVLNWAAKLGGAPDETIETTSIKDAKMRTDVDKASSVVDLDGGRFINIDHGGKTYTIVTMPQMVQLAKDMGNQAKAAQAEARSEAARSNARKPEGEVDFKFDLKVDRTGEKQKLSGYDAERVFITMKTDMTYTPEGQTKAEDAGTLIILTDSWNSKVLPIEKAFERFAQAAPAAAKKAGAQNLSGSFPDPKLGAALEKAMEEAEKIEGTAVKQTVYMVLLPPGLEFNRALALNTGAAKEENKNSGLKGLARGALGNMMGAKKEEQKQEDPKPQQTTLVTITTELRDIQLKSLPASLFEPPTGYKETPVQLPK